MCKDFFSAWFDCCYPSISMYFVTFDSFFVFLMMFSEF